MPDHLWLHHHWLLLLSIRIGTVVLMVASAAAVNGTPSFPLQLIPVPTHMPPETNLSIFKVDPHERASYLLASTESFRVVVPPRGDDHCKLEKTSQQSTHNHCHFATNGGPFHADGTCAGAVIVNSTTIAFDFGGSSVGFGITTNNQHPSNNDNNQQQWVIGNVQSEQHAIEELGLQYYVTGFDWLVYEGISVARQFNNTTGAERAPRTAIGVTADGILLILVTDGCQLCLHRRGLTLEQLADKMVQAGAAFAINLDGGSSSVLVQRNRGVISRPTCLDVLPVKCERPVASVLCLQQQSPSSNSNSSKVVEQRRPSLLRKNMNEIQDYSTY